MVTTEDLARKWDDAWDSAPEAANTFREELRRQEKATGRLTDAGSLSSIQKNSSSQSYAQSGQGNLTTLENARAWRQLIQMFDRIYVSLTNKSDEAVYAQGKLELSQPCTEAYIDATCLRYP